MPDQTVTITYSNGAYQMNPPSPRIGLDNTITFDVRNDCCICFSPAGYFGRRLKLPAGVHGPYAPADNAPPPPPLVDVNYCITDIQSRCTPAAVQGITSYSIKVG
jgi:hypothetical protein